MIYHREKILNAENANVFNVHRRVIPEEHRAAGKEHRGDGAQKVGKLGIVSELGVFIPSKAYDNGI